MCISTWIILIEMQARKFEDIFDSKQEKTGEAQTVIQSRNSELRTRIPQGLLWCSVIKTSPFNPGDAALIPGEGVKIPRASRPENQIIKQKQYSNKFNKDFRNDPHQKNLKKKNLSITTILNHDLSQPKSSVALADLAQTRRAKGLSPSSTYHLGGCGSRSLTPTFLRDSFLL